MSVKHYDTQKVEKIHKFLTTGLSVRVASVVATDAVIEMQRVSNATPIPTMAVGRAMIGALLIAANHLKESNQQVGIYFQGNGPLKKVFAEANFAGEVRGYTTTPDLGPENDDGVMWTVGKGIGIGLLSVSKHLPYQPPHKGVVEIVSGEVGDDLAYYLHQSFQIQSVVSLGVQLDRFGKVKAAGGVLIEVMPGASDQVLEVIEENMKRAPSVTSLILSGSNGEDLVKPFLEGMDYAELEHDHCVHYVCKCSEEKVEGVLIMLGVDEINKMLAKKEDVEVTCEFCGRPFIFALERLQRIKGQLLKEGLN